ERFAVLLREFPDSARTREAGYYRFRALDSARASDASLTPAYEQALDAYLAAHPKADGAAEARYLLAELHRARGECKRAQAEYAQVGPGPFAARAHLGDLECRVAMLGKGNEGRKEVLAALRAFARDAAEKGLGARAALLGAVVAAGATPPDQGAVVELLDGFENHYPDAQELHPRALELRLAARVATGQLAEASRDLDAFLALRTDAAERRGTLRAAAAQGDREHALAYWRSVLDASPPGGTAWYEARVAQVTLLAEDGQKAEACELLHAARGRATSAGGDQLEARLREMEPRVCQ